MKTLIIATGNKNKMKEIREILGRDDLTILSMAEAGIEADILENGTTFEENAVIKARTVAAACGHMAMADDSGLVVDALGGEPGIYSARYMGEDTSYEIKNAAIIDRVNRAPGGDTPEGRSARFVCACACAWPDGRVITTQGVMEGQIAQAPAGENGFGYDPIFYLPDAGCTSAELSPEEKNARSHRGQALRAMAAALDELRGGEEEA